MKPEAGRGRFMLKYPPNEWQYTDDRGIVMPWYTDRFLRRLINWDVSNWRVLEVGAGYSTIWWASRCHQLVAIEHDDDWLESVHDAVHRLCGLQVRMWQVAPGASVSHTVELRKGPFDCIIVDGGGDREACVVAAINILCDGGVLIVDNTEDIDFVRMPPCLRFNERHDFPMTNHPRCVTSYWIITERRSEIPPPEQWRVLQEHPETLRMEGTRSEQP